MFHREGQRAEDEHRAEKNCRLPAALAEAEPLEAVGQILHELALAPPAKCFAPRHHRGERDDDAGQP